MKALDIAYYFLHKANQDGDTITNLKMQKLLYYAQAWYLVNFNEPLFEDSIEAWPYGPVISKVYHQFKKFKNMPIKYKDTGKEKENFTDKELDYLNQFYNKFIEYSAHTLARATHNDSPWRDAIDEGEHIIDNRIIKDFYTKQYEKRNVEKPKD